MKNRKQLVNIKTVKELLIEMNDFAMTLEGKDSDVIEEAMKLIINHFAEKNNETK